MYLFCKYAEGSNSYQVVYVKQEGSKKSTHPPSTAVIRIAINMHCVSRFRALRLAIPVHCVRPRAKQHRDHMRARLQCTSHADLETRKGRESRPWGELASVVAPFPLAYFQHGDRDLGVGRGRGGCRAKPSTSASSAGPRLEPLS